MAINKKDLLFETDILIVGSGSSGLWAAHAVKKKDKSVKVLLVDKGPENWGGLMACAGGDFEAVLPDESIDDWVKDWVYYFDGLCDQELMETIFSQSYERLKEYQDWGCEYLADENGKLVSVLQRGLNTIKLFVTKIKGSGGQRMVDALAKAVKQEGVESLGRTMLTDIIKDDAGKVIGAIGFNTRDGNFVQVKAKAILIATGLGGWKSSYMKNPSTGEGIEMAFRAGAEMRNLEFNRVWNVPKLFGWEGQTTLLPLGARFVNADGEDLMSRYSATFGGNTDPHYTTVAMALETRAGRGPIYLDTSALQEKDAAIVKPKMGWQLINHKRLEELGIHFFSGKTEWMPQPLMSYGGLLADLKGATRVNGLYVAGRARSIDPGVYTGGFGLSITATTGHIAGEAMVDYIKAGASETPEFNQNEIDGLRKKLYSPLNGTGINAKEVLRAIQRIVYPDDVSIIKSEHSLQNALHKLEGLQKEVIPLMGASDPHYLMKLKEIEAIAFITEWYLKASLMRTESRCGHYREDFPDHKEDWLKWIVIGLENGRPEMKTVDVPIASYKHPIIKYYQDNFNFSG